MGSIHCSPRSDASSGSSTNLEGATVGHCRSGFYIHVLATSFAESDCVRGAIIYLRKRDSSRFKLVSLGIQSDFEVSNGGIIVRSAFKSDGDTIHLKGKAIR